MNTGKMDQRITIERATTLADTFGTPVPSWSAYLSCWAEVRYGTGQERREAAQQVASAPATFRIRYSVAAAGIAEIDRIAHRGATWDIKSVVELGRNEGIEITATRSL